MFKTDKQIFKNWKQYLGKHISIKLKGVQNSRLLHVCTCIQKLIQLKFSKFIFKKGDCENNVNY